MRIHANFPLHRPVIGVKTSLRELIRAQFLLVVCPVAVFEVCLMDVCQPGEAAQ